MSHNFNIRNGISFNFVFNDMFCLLTDVNVAKSPPQPPILVKKLRTQKYIWMFCQKCFNV